MAMRGTRVLITGGTAGLGAAVALRFAAEGAHIAINYAASKDRALSLQSKIKGTYSGANVVVLQGDVSQSGVCTRLVEETVKELGGLDCIVSNAGWTKAAPWEDLDALSEEDWDRTWAMNVKAHLFLFRAAKPHFLRNAKGGNMIMTSSVAGVKASGSALAYSVTKHAAVALARGLALHQGPKCRINTVAPGLLATEWSEQQFGEQKMQAIQDVTPLKRLASLEDCADAFFLLASSSSITGQTLVVDGGFSLK